MAGVWIRQGRTKTRLVQSHATWARQRWRENSVLERGGAILPSCKLDKYGTYERQGWRENSVLGRDGMLQQVCDLDKDGNRTKLDRSYCMRETEMARKQCDRVRWSDNVAVWDGQGRNNKDRNISRTYVRRRCSENSVPE